MSESVVVEPPVPEEQLLLIAPILVGCLLSYLLMGVSIVQLYIYYISYRTDTWLIKVTVYSVFLLDIAQSVAVAGHGYATLCEQWGRPKAGHLMYWWNGPLPILSSTLAFWCQTFYVWRIYQLSEWRIIPAAVLLISLAQTGAAYAIGVVAPSLINLSELHRPNMTARTIIWLAGGALADVIIMLSMVYLLLTTRNATFILRRSELIINRLIRVSVETGCFCAATAALELIAFLALPKTSLHFVFSFMLGKVYSNTLMASLNSRRNPASWGGSEKQKKSMAETESFSLSQPHLMQPETGAVLTSVLSPSLSPSSPAGHYEIDVEKSPPTYPDLASAV